MREMQRLAEEGSRWIAGAAPASKQAPANPAPPAQIVCGTPPPPAPVPPVPPPAASVVLEFKTNPFPEKERFMDRDLRDDMLKLVKYRILFVKREYEASFGEEEAVIEDNMDGAALTAWKTAEFMEDLRTRGRRIPTKWRDTTYPPNFRDIPNVGEFNGIPEEDKKYLRVSYEVLERYPRERFKYEEQQIKILGDIRDKVH
jgi:hypothetical protein